MNDTQVEPRSEGVERDAARLQEQVIAFIRSFGLLRSNATPCGRSLSVSEAHAMLELSRRAGWSQAALGHRLRLEKSTISRLINQLQGKGWVERVRNPADGRAVRLRITEQGCHVADQVAVARSDYFARLIERIPAANREDVVGAFQIVVEALEDQDMVSFNEEEGDERGRCERLRMEIAGKQTSPKHPARRAAASVADDSRGATIRT